MRETIIATVLKTGEFSPRQRHAVSYEPAHVIWLKKQVEKALADDLVPFRFVCLSDVGIQGVESIPLIHRWDGWWSKMELFSQAHRLENVLYLDLDTVVTGPLARICDYPHGFTTLLNISRRAGIGSGMMAWTKTPGFLYEEFADAPEHHMRFYTENHLWGDQGFIQSRLKKIISHCGIHEYFQAAFPGDIASWKYDMRPGSGPPPGAKVVIFNGQPKPWHVQGEGWIPPLKSSY